MIKVEGIEQAIAQMKQLETATSRKVLIMALRRASRPLIKQMKQLAPEAERNVKEFWGKRLTVEPGTLKRSIRAIVPKRKSDRLAEMLVGPTKLKKGRRANIAKKGSAVRNDGWFRHFVIRGTAGFTIKKGKNKGRYMPGQAANPFPDKAYSQSGEFVSRELEAAIVSQLNKILSK